MLVSASPRKGGNSIVSSRSVAIFTSVFATPILNALPLLPRLVFLVVGPAVDLKLMAMQTGVFGRRFVARFAPLCLIVAVVCGTAAGALFVGWR